MNRHTLILNDFESFDRFLFDGETPHWDKFGVFLDGMLRFNPPIEKPETIEEYQLNHYTYWMFIAYMYNGKCKPPILSTEPLKNNCFACAYARHQDCHSPYCICPIQSEKAKKSWPDSSCQSYEFHVWQEDLTKANSIALAKTIWRIPETPCQLSDKNFSYKITLM